MMLAPVTHATPIRRIGLRSALAGLVALLLWSPAVAAIEDGQVRPQREGIVDLPYYRDPSLSPPRVESILDDRLEGLWLAALNSDDPSVKVPALQAFAKAHVEAGLAVGSAARQAIVRHLDDEDVNVAVAAVRTLEALDERSAAPRIAELSRQWPHPYIAPSADRVLAAWDDASMRQVWRDRALDATQPRAVRRSAIEALGTVADPDALDPLLSLTIEPTQLTDLRLASAAALGSIAREGLTDDAASLSETDSLGALLAVSMLRSHSDEATWALLNRLTGHADPGVAAAAANLLADRAPQRLDTALVGHGDASVRFAVARAVLTAPSPQSVAVLGELLDDPTVRNRVLARDTLIEWAAQTDLRPVITQQIEAVWANPSWRGREQAALIAGWIDHKPLATKLADALDHDRPEVRLAVALALRRLQVEQTAPAIQQRLEQLLKPIPENVLTENPDLVVYSDGETTQLFLALGYLNWRDAEPLFRRVIPKGSVPYSEGRTAAIYVLGKWHEGQPDHDLARQLISRMRDMSFEFPEYAPVQLFSAIALGRMGDPVWTEDLLWAATSNTFMGGPEGAEAARWSYQRITGEQLPREPLSPGNIRGWFLEPVR